MKRAALALAILLGLPACSGPAQAPPSPSPSPSAHAAAPNPGDGHLATARGLMEKKQYHKAADEAKLAVGILSISAANPSQMTAARLLLARACYLDNRHGEALEQYRQITTPLDAANQKVKHSLEQEQERHKQELAAKQEEKRQAAQDAAAANQAPPDGPLAALTGSVKAGSAKSFTLAGNFGTINRAFAFQDPEFGYFSGTTFLPPDWRPQAGDHVFVQYQMGPEGTLAAMSVEHLQGSHHHMTGYWDNGKRELSISQHAIDTQVSPDRAVPLFTIQATADSNYVVSGFTGDPLRYEGSDGHLAPGQSVTVTVTISDRFHGTQSDMLEVTTRTGGWYKIPVTLRAP